MDYLLFEKILIKRAWGFSILCFTIIILSVLALTYIIKNMANEKVLSSILIVLCVCAIAGSVVLGTNIVGGSISDIKNRSYIVYKGDFVVGDDVETPSKTYSVYVPDKDGIHLEASDTRILYSGEYWGEIIYAKKTKIAFKIEDWQRKSSSSPNPN